MADAVHRAADPFVRINRRQKWLILATFAAYLGLAAVARRYDVTPTEDWVSALLALYVAALVAPLFTLRTSLGWFHPLVFSSLLRLVDLVRRFTMYSTGLDWHRALPSSGEELSHLTELHLVLHTVAVLSHYAGFAVGPRLPLPMLRFDTPRALVPKLLVLSGVAAVVFAAYVLQRGGLSAHVSSWALGRREQLAGTHYLIAIANLGIPACWIWLAYQRKATRSPLFWAVTLTALAIAFLASGSRSSVVYPAVVGLIIWMLRERRISYLGVIVGALVTLYAIAVLGAYRWSGWSGENDWDAATDTPFVDAVTSGAGGELTERASTHDGALPIFARVPDDVPLLYGDSYLAVLTLPVPRVLWPDKPGMVDGRVGATFFGSLAGIPPGGVGEAYWNFHVAGVVVVFFFFGMFHRWLAQLYRRHADRPAAIILYAATLLLFREPASSTFVTWQLVLVPVVVMLVALGGLGLGRDRPRGLGRGPGLGTMPAKVVP